MNFEGCEIEYSGGIISVGNCKEMKGAELYLSDVAFTGNEIIDAAAIWMDYPPCSKLSLANVNFIGNDCNGIFCGAMMGVSNKIENVKLSDNGQRPGAITLPSLLYAPPDSENVVVNLQSSNNKGTTLMIDGGALEMRMSRFEGNSVEGRLVASASVQLRDAAASIDGCTFDTNSADYGSGVFLDKSTAEIVATSLIDNSAGVRGGAVASAYGSLLTLDKTSFETNSAAADGGGLYAEYSTVIGRNVKFVGNQAAEDGAGFCCAFRCIASMEGSGFTDNKASNGAAMKFDSGSEGDFTECTFSGNTAEKNGGACQAVDATMDYESCAFSSNTAGNGASISTVAAEVRVAECEMKSETAKTAGGSFYINEKSRLTIVGSNITESSSGLGGGIAIGGDSVMEGHDTQIVGCQTTTDGGAIFTNGSAVICNSCSFKDNVAEGVGGGLYFAIGQGQGVDIDLTDSTFDNNAAQTANEIILAQDVCNSF